MKGEMRGKKSSSIKIAKWLRYSAPICPGFEFCLIHYLHVQVILSLLVLRFHPALIKSILYDLATLAITQKKRKKKTLEVVFEEDGDSSLDS